ncbi:MAG: hypothetical protein QXT27_00610 [Pyrobaculum sp.]
MIDVDHWHHVHLSGDLDVPQIRQAHFPLRHLRRIAWQGWDVWGYVGLGLDPSVGE